MGVRSESTVAVYSSNEKDKLLPLVVYATPPKPRNYTTGRAQRKDDEQNAVFNIESVVCGDGQSDKSSKSLRNLIWYASDRLDGGIESYYEIDPDTVILTTRGGRKGGNWHTRPLTSSAAKRGKQDVPRVSIPTKKRNNHIWVRNKLRDIALKWLAQNRGWAISVGGPGERKEISEAPTYLVRDYGTTFISQNDGNCMTAAITNAVDILAGRKIACEMHEYFLDENPHILKIGQAVQILHMFATGLEMRKIAKGDRSAFKENPFAYLASLKRGVFLVHVFQPKLVSHTIVIDGNRKLVIDSAEEFPMRLCEDLLRKCGGDDAKNLRIGGVRQIVRQKQP